MNGQPDAYPTVINLVTNDGKEFKVDRNILSQASPFFEKLLNSDMKESREGTIHMELIHGSLMKDVLQFIYDGRVRMTSRENAQEMFEAADFLCLRKLKNIAWRFLQQTLSFSNCLSTYYLAEKYQCEELQSNASEFIHQNFSMVANTEEFLNLPVQEVERWISSDDIVTLEEKEVFEIVLRWINGDKTLRRERKINFEELFRHVRLDFIPRRQLKKDLITNDLVKKNKGCRKLVKRVLANRTGQWQPRRDTLVLFACGGCDTFCYDPQKAKWYSLARSKHEFKDPRTLLTFHGKVYSFNLKLFGPGFQRFDPLSNHWCMLGFPRKHIPNLVTVLQGGIYGTVSVTRGVFISKYDVDSNVWEKIPSSDGEIDEGACIVGENNSLFFIGGIPASTVTKKFDITELKWEKIADMQQGRYSAFGEAHHGKIFIAGGRQHSDHHLKSCEVYDVVTNEWQFIASLNLPRSDGSMVCYLGTMYVLGGMSTEGMSRALTVEYYDSESNKWIEATAIPSTEPASCNFQACLLRHFKECDTFD